MATVKEIKEELQFNRELTGLLEVMRDVAVFQFRALQRKKERFIKFGRLLKGFFEMVDWQKTPHHFINPRTDKLGIIMITSDEGFMGGLNLKVVNASLMEPTAGVAKLIIVGERGRRYLKEMSREFVAFSTGKRSAFDGKAAEDAGKYELALELREHIIKGVKSGEFGRVIVSYPKSISFMAQKVEIVEILPIHSLLRGRERNPSLRGRERNPSLRGREAPEAISKQEIASSAPAAPPRNDEGRASFRNDDIIIESPPEGIIEYLVGEMMLQKLLEVLEESKLSEFAARAIHLEKSSRELTEQEKHIKFQYFRVYRESIDKNTRELFSAQIIRRKR
ncbi:MAG: F0F1 ATP synthase subunit gamma [Candidatus Omnitrophota bacterium]